MMIFYKLGNTHTNYNLSVFYILGQIASEPKKGRRFVVLCQFQGSEAKCSLTPDATVPYPHLRFEVVAAALLWRAFGARTVT